MSKSNIINKDGEFYKSWGSLYDEFKIDKGFFSSQFYTIHLLRRLGFLLSQVYLNDFLFFQGVLNTLGSFVQVIYLIYYKPFKETSVLISYLTGEIATTLTMILVYFYLFDLSSNSSETVELVTIYSIIGAIAIQFIISIYSVEKAIREIWKKIKKRRASLILKFSAQRFDAT